MNSASLKKTIAEERMYKATFKELILSVYMWRSPRKEWKIKKKWILNKIHTYIYSRRQYKVSVPFTDRTILLKNV